MLPLKVLPLLVHVLVGGYAESDVATPGLKEGGGLSQAGNTGWQNDPGYSSRAHGGAIEAPGEYKSLVFIRIAELYFDAWNFTRNRIVRYNCTGQILSTKWILTAAQCLPCQYLYQLTHTDNRYMSGEQAFEVLTQGSESYEARRVKNFFAHPESRISEHDCLIDDILVEKVNVGLLEMVEDLQFSATVGPIALMVGQMPSWKHNCTLQGYGFQHSSPPSSHVTTLDDQLHYEHVDAVNHKLCRELYNKRIDEDFHLCSHIPAERTDSACIGGLGSGLLCTALDGELVSVGVLVGFISPDGRCASNDSVRVYVSSGHAEQWISYKTGDPTIVFKRV